MKAKTHRHKHRISLCIILRMDKFHEFVHPNSKYEMKLKPNPNILLWLKLVLFEVLSSLDAFWWNSIDLFRLNTLLVLKCSNQLYLFIRLNCLKWGQSTKHEHQYFDYCHITSWNAGHFIDNANSNIMLVWI